MKTAGLKLLGFRQLRLLRPSSLTRLLPFDAANSGRYGSFFVWCQQMVGKEREHFQTVQKPACSRRRPQTVWSAEVVPEKKIDGAIIGSSLRADNGLTVWKGWRPCFHHIGHAGGPCHTTNRMHVRKLRKSREANEHLTGHPGL